ncbi:hypothetical protein [Pseudomonas sp. 8AS]|uniref:hypothetical protein n=1 Tax=Pseudomonas sp. 8AS TaxID=2653163 RepID=UPI0013569EEB|nr:hypothetical protein [Pseudomonas sp. 8AS]
MNTKAIIGLLALSVLSGCAQHQASSDAPGNSLKSRKVMFMSNKVADIIRQLPADADLENMADQQTLVKEGMYLTWSGEHRYLDEAANKARVDSVVKPVVAPAAPRNKATSIQSESIQLDTMPAPIVIE